MSMTHWLAFAGLVVIVSLIVYALVLWRRVWRAGRQQSAREAARNRRLAGDIQFLAQGLLDERVPLIEGAIRIKVLLDNYSGPRPADLDVQVFERIYVATAHIPTHRDWRSLTPSERRLHEQHMEQLERIHLKDAEQAARQLSAGLV